MIRNDLFIHLAQVFDGDLPIEKLAREALLAHAGTQLELGQGKPLSQPFVTAMQDEDAHEVCASVLELPFDWAPPQTSKTKLYQEHSVFKAHIELLGPDGLIHSDQVRLGFYGMLPHCEYGIRTHPAEEVYIMIAGHSLWKRGEQPYQPATVGDRSHHPSFMPHASKTTDSAFMAMFAWSGDISKDQYIYEGLPEKEG